MADGKERPWKQRPLSVLTLYNETNKVEVNVLPIPSLHGSTFVLFELSSGIFPLLCLAICNRRPFLRRLQ